jgi:hypothetical protein
MRSVMILAPPSISAFSLRAHGSVSTKSSLPTRPRAVWYQSASFSGWQPMA